MAAINMMGLGGPYQSHQMYHHDPTATMAISGDLHPLPPPHPQQLLGVSSIGPSSPTTLELAFREAYITKELSLVRDDVLQRHHGDMVLTPPTLSTGGFYGAPITIARGALFPGSPAGDAGALSGGEYSRRPPPSVVAATQYLQGIIFVRRQHSPWFKGAFGFKIFLPVTYPRSFPVIEFDALLGLPQLCDGRRVPIEEALSRVDPMKQSYLVVATNIVRSLFAVDVNALHQPEAFKKRGRLDVEKKSLMSASSMLLDERSQQAALEGQLPGPGASYAAHLVSTGWWIVKSAAALEMGATTASTCPPPQQEGSQAPPLSAATTSDPLQAKSPLLWLIAATISWITTVRRANQPR